jgi:hypothetical protein
MGAKLCPGTAEGREGDMGRLPELSGGWKPYRNGRRQLYAFKRLGCRQYSIYLGKSPTKEEAEARIKEYCRKRGLEPWLENDPAAALRRRIREVKERLLRAILGQL